MILPGSNGFSLIGETSDAIFSAGTTALISLTGGLSSCTVFITVSSVADGAFSRLFLIASLLPCPNHISCQDIYKFSN